MPWEPSSSTHVALDAEVKSRVADAKPDEKRFLSRFAQAWSALDAAAIYLKLDTDLEAGVSVQFQPGKLPDDLKRWLTGPASRSLPSALIPQNAIMGAAGHLRAVELIELVASLAPIEDGKPGVKEWLELTLGPIVGRDKLPLVLNALGPDWAAWAEPPVEHGFLPTAVAVIQISGNGEERTKAEKALTQGIEFGFQMLRGLQRQTYSSDRTEGRDGPEERHRPPFTGQREGVPAWLPTIVCGGEGLPGPGHFARGDPAFYSTGRGHPARVATPANTN